MKIKTIIKDQISTFDLLINNNQLQINGKKIDCVSLKENLYSLIFNGRVYYIHVTAKLDYYEIIVNQDTYNVIIKDELDVLIEKYGIKKESENKIGKIFSEIPGLVSKIYFKIGDKVKKGEKLCILEAMKMENEIISPLNGVITKINIMPGDIIDKGYQIMEIIN